MAELVEFIECGGLSITYEANGRASINANIIKSNTNALTTNYNTWSLGGVSFVGNVMSASQKPMIGSGGWGQWQLNWQGVGN